MNTPRANSCSTVLERLRADYAPLVHGFAIELVPASYVTQASQFGHTGKQRSLPSDWSGTPLGEWLKLIHHCGYRRSLKFIGSRLTYSGRTPFGPRRDESPYLRAIHRVQATFAALRRESDSFRSLPTLSSPLLRSLTASACDLSDPRFSPLGVSGLPVGLRSCEQEGLSQVRQGPVK